MVDNARAATSKQILLVYNPTTVFGFWEKYAFFAKHIRESSNYPDYWVPLELLYEEVKRLYPDIRVDTAIATSVSSKTLS